MESIIGKKLIKNISLFSIATIISVLGNTVSAKATEMNLGEKLNEIKGNYESESLQFINGVLLNIGENIDIKEYASTEFDGEIKEIINEENSIISLEGSNITAKEEGTTFLILKTEDKNYVVEVSTLKNNTYARASSYDINRDYYKVFIDPGHGGADPGALGNGLRESDLNLTISKKVKDKLKANNIEIMMSRESDEYISLAKRAKDANEYGADAFISVHQNAATASAKGIETYYHSNKESYKPFASAIQNQMIKNTGATNRGVKSANFQVIKESNMVSALLECGFITNRSESSNLNNNSYQDKLATAIADAITGYLEENIKLNPSKPLDPGVFRDTNNHWAKEEIKEFTLKGYMEGYEDGTFKPDKSITRVEFIKIVNKSFNFTTEGEESFSDVSNKDWFYSEVKKAVKAGYITTKNKKFRPNDTITREEVASILTSIKKNKDTNLDKLNKYSDSNMVSEWAKSSVEGAIEAGYMGKGDNKFRPKDKITRAEAVVSLNRIK